MLTRLALSVLLVLVAGGCDSTKSEAAPVLLTIEPDVRDYSFEGVISFTRLLHEDGVEIARARFREQTPQQVTVPAGQYTAVVYLGACAEPLCSTQWGDVLGDKPHCTEVINLGPPGAVKHLRYSLRIPMPSRTEELCRIDL